MGIGQVRQAVFLDRDGVINDVVVREGKPYPPANINELTIPKDVLHALQQLKNAGFLLLGESRDKKAG